VSNQPLALLEPNFLTFVSNQPLALLELNFLTFLPKQPRALLELFFYLRVTNIIFKPCRPRESPLQTDYMKKQEKQEKLTKAFGLMKLMLNALSDWSNIVLGIKAFGLMKPMTSKQIDFSSGGLPTKSTVPGKQLTDLHGAS